MLPARTYVIGRLARSFRVNSRGTSDASAGCSFLLCFTGSVCFVGGVVRFEGHLVPPSTIFVAATPAIRRPFKVFQHLKGHIGCRDVLAGPCFVFTQARRLSSRSQTSKMVMS